MSKGSKIPFSLTGKGSVVKQKLEINGTPLTIDVVGHSAFGGDNSAPSPLDYALAALSSCTQVTSQIIASQDPSIKLGEWSIELNSHLDNSVLVFGEEGVSNFSDVHLDITVETNLDAEKFAAFAYEVERRCPMTQLFRGSGVKFSSEWKNIELRKVA
ncbi:OsmC family protein [Paenochrobactrum sp. BZR 588]|uniref:OsmC family protein n=1 Tax=unclassified Paenochrobactrum TaxID=2639760 RepID=UPI0038524023